MYSLFMPFTQVPRAEILPFVVLMRNLWGVAFLLVERLFKMAS